LKPTSANEFPLDESIQFLVDSKEWATPFLSYLVHILREGNGLRKLVAPAKVLEYTSDYQNDNDGIAKFISDKLIALKEGDEILQIDTTTLKRAFKSWKDDNDQKSLSPSDMVKRVENQFGKYPRGGWSNFRMDI
jgi:phage/plasmid-associated DNA primase